MNLLLPKPQHWGKDKLFHDVQLDISVATSSESEGIQYHCYPCSGYLEGLAMVWAGQWFGSSQLVSGRSTRGGSSYPPRDTRSTQETDDGQWCAQMEQYMAKMNENHRKHLEHRNAVHEHRIVELMDVITG
ncbi:hypothetical protein Syun_009419 [Stephania yunnanensis]|uniref:Uncharacterized protein n=1 Tax=Stephania yunnanensis TaxID=152371 RepID=A0AAP0KH39_9MAGN